MLTMTITACHQKLPNEWLRINIVKSFVASLCFILAIVVYIIKSYLLWPAKTSLTLKKSTKKLCKHYISTNILWSIQLRLFKQLVQLNSGWKCLTYNIAHFARRINGKLFQFLVLRIWLHKLLLLRNTLVVRHSSTIPVRCRGWGHFCVCGFSWHFYAWCACVKLEIKNGWK